MLTYPIDQNILPGFYFLFFCFPIIYLSFSLFKKVCVCMHACACVCMYGEAKEGHWVSFSVTHHIILRQILLLTLEIITEPDYLGPSHLHSVALGAQACAPMHSLFMGCRGSELRPQCLPNTLPTEPFPQPHFLFLLACQKFVVNQLISVISLRL